MFMAVLLRLFGDSPPYRKDAPQQQQVATKKTEDKLEWGREACALYALQWCGHVAECNPEAYFNLLTVERSGAVGFSAGKAFYFVTAGPLS